MEDNMITKPIRWPIEIDDRATADMKTGGG